MKKFYTSALIVLALSSVVLAETSDYSGAVVQQELITLGTDRADGGSSTNASLNTIFANTYDSEGYDANGFDNEGYNREGYNASGYDRDGYNREGYNTSGYDREGYDAHGYNQNGNDRDGNHKKLIYVDTPREDGIVKIKSNHDFNTTVARVRAAIEASPLTLVTTVDHAANAANNNLELRPTTLFIFGNPNVGTPLMQAVQTLAIDLPQKMLVWQDEGGYVYVGFNSPFYLETRHNVVGQAERLTTINTVLGNLAKSATQ